MESSTISGEKSDWIKRNIDQRHFKKDSRYVSDLYTLTFVPESAENLEKLSYLDLQRGTASAADVSAADPTHSLDEYQEDDEMWRGSSLVARRRSRPGGREDCEQFQSLPVTLSSQEPALTLVQHQLQLQEEARLALAQAARMARWQVQLERQNRADVVARAVRQHTDHSVLQDAALPEGAVDEGVLKLLGHQQLTSVVDTLRGHVTELNCRLLQLLEERDELLIEQAAQLKSAELAAVDSVCPGAAAAAAGGGALSTGQCLVQPPSQLLRTARRKSEQERAPRRPRSQQQQQQQQQKRSSFSRLW